MKITASIFALVLAASVGAQAQSTQPTAQVPSLKDLEISAQQDLNAYRWRRAWIERCQRDSNSVEIASFCNGEAFGYPQMGSQGD